MLRTYGGSLWVFPVLLALTPACGGAPAPPAAPVAPSPSSVTKDEPGGDAPDPRRAALQRLLQEPFGTRRDKPHTLRVRFPDSRNWTRVRYWGYPTRAGFRYGDEHYAAAALFYLPAASPEEGPSGCLERFFTRVQGTAKTLGVELTNIRREAGTSHERLSVLEPAPKPADAAVDARPSQERVERTMPVIRAEAAFTSLTNQGRWIVAATSYASWPGTCLIQGFGVKGEDEPELAAAVVERWVREGAGQAIWERELWQAPPFEDR